MTGEVINHNQFTYRKYDNYGHSISSLHTAAYFDCIQAYIKPISFYELAKLTYNHPNLSY